MAAQIKESRPLFRSLAAAVALRARDTDGPAIVGQILIYPIVDTNFDTDSYQRYHEGFGLSREIMLWFMNHYLGDDFPRDQTPDPWVAPLHADSLQGLPQVHLVTAEYDVLRTEGELYAAALQDAGVPTTHKQYSGMLHGFIHLAGVFDTGRAAISDLAEVVRRYVEHR